MEFVASLGRPIGARDLRGASTFGIARSHSRIADGDQGQLGVRVQPHAIALATRRAWESHKLFWEPPRVTVRVNAGAT